jgi:4-alpha-glucanotransferase
MNKPAPITSTSNGSRTANSVNSPKSHRGIQPGSILICRSGCTPSGFDVWREPDSFALGIAGGAPPDSFFTTGQNWGFAPVHPERIRADGYRHYIQCLRHHMRYARVLRIDHVMNLHRLYWIPPGFEATDGAYVGCRADEFYAVLALE